MIQRLNDARYALGFGVVFLGYAAWLAWDYLREQRRIRTDTIARLVYDDAGSRASEMREQEFTL